MRLKTIWFLLLGCCLNAAAFAQGGHRGAWPRFFAPDDALRGFAHSTLPSDVVLDALLNTPEAKDAHQELEGREREKLRSLFQVVPVDLGPAHEKDYVALGSDPLSGADCFWFWIVRVRDGRAKVLLFSNGLTLTLRKNETNGYRDIRGDWATAAYIGSELFRYDGSTYKLLWKHTKENR